MSSLLRTLSVGDEIPWRLDASGKPQWLVVSKVVEVGLYEVRYPDGKTELLRDSE
jgi:hypothetical protein